MLSSENRPAPQDKTTPQDESTRQEAAKQSKGNPLAETIREGAVAANIFVGTSKEGKSYHYFALSRSWKNAEGQSGYSGSFYPKNSDALARVVATAADRCEELDSAKSESS